VAMKALLALFVFSCVFASVPEDGELSTYSFPQYVKDFSKIYSKEEYEIHEHIFEVRLADIIHHNSLSSQRYKKGVNKFTDMTDSEFKAYRGYNPRMSAALFASPDQPCVQQPLPTYPNDLPASIDWRTAKPAVLTPVKDQGQCGSCWAFATAETVESALALATGGNLTVLSPQNVVSCTVNPDNCGGSGGCNGAIAELGFNYIKDNGIATETNWPYKAVTGECDETSHTKVATVGGCVKLVENNYTDLLAAVATIGPIAVSVDASTWNSYSKGIYDACDKEKTMDIDHAVQLVGYGTESGTDYWIVRNSWGPNWGEAGFIRLLRHSDGGDSWCKADTTPSDGNGCDGGPSTITVCGDCGIWFDSSYPTGAKYL